MSIPELLYIILIIGFLVIVVCTVIITYYLVLALKSLKNLTTSLEDTAENIKSRLQLKVLAAIPSLLIALVGRILKRGR